MKAFSVLETIVTEPLVRLTSSDLHIDKAEWIRRLINFEGLHEDLLKLKLDNGYDEWFIVVFEIGKISPNDQLVNFIPKLVVQDANIKSEIIMELFDYELGRFSKMCHRGQVNLYRCWLNSSANEIVACPANQT